MVLFFVLPFLKKEMARLGSGREGGKKRAVRAVSRGGGPRNPMVRIPFGAKSPLDPKYRRFISNGTRFYQPDTGMGRVFMKRQFLSNKHPKYAADLYPFLPKVFGFDPVEKEAPKQAKAKMLAEMPWARREQMILSNAFMDTIEQLRAQQKNLQPLGKSPAEAVHGDEDMDGDDDRDADGYDTYDEEEDEDDDKGKGKEEKKSEDTLGPIPGTGAVVGDKKKGRTLSSTPTPRSPTPRVPRRSPRNISQDK